MPVDLQVSMTTRPSPCRVGDVASLSVEVVVNPTNENLTDKNPVSSRLMEVAGPELKEECKSQIVSESL